MKITHQSPERLVLSGVPGGMGWMLFATMLGAALTAAVVAAAVFEFRRDGLSGNHLWIGLGGIVAQAIFWMGAVTLAVGRERLELDRVTRKGSYTVRSPIVETEQPCRFTFDRIAGVVVNHSTEARPGRADGRRSLDAQVVTAKLRITKPRRAIVLDSTENGQHERITALATAVAEFLEISPSETGEPNRDERDTSADASTAAGS